MPTNYGRRLKIDSKMASEISRSPSMLAEQGGRNAFLARYGGTAVFKGLAKAPVSARVLYYAVQDGLNDEASIGVATGLNRSEIAHGKEWLVSRGYIQDGDIVGEGGE